MTEGTYLLDRIRARCIDDAGCWIWQGCAQKGVMPMMHFKRSSMGVRRAVFEATYGPVKKGFEVVAKCESMLCVAPEHLEQITKKERRRRMAEKTNKPRPLWKPPHSKLSTEKARQIRTSEEPTAVLAERYGVSGSAINYVRAGLTWAEPSPWSGLGARA